MEELQRHPEAIRPPATRPIGRPIGRPIDSGIRTGGNDDIDAAGTVQITWGALIDDLEVAGMTVGQVQALLQAAYNLAPGVQVNVNGDEADEDTVLTTGDALEFVRAAGEKGGD